jgi:hypothetical protein
MKIDLQKGAESMGSALGKGAEGVGNAIGKAAEIGKIAAYGVKASAQLLADKAQEENLKAQLKKYNPVFPDQYGVPGFNLSNLIMIVDDVVRKDIEVCKGAIGWKSQEKGMEVFHLYDEAIAFSGLHFVPAAVCDAIYYVDTHDRRRFIRLDCYFEKMQEAKLAELQHIAYSLGAKKYSVEMFDTSSEKRTSKQKVSLSGKAGVGAGKKAVAASEERGLTAEKETQREAVASAEFTGDMKPTQPVLRWFAHDDNIKNLIHMRCSGEGNNGVKKYSIEFKVSDYATMGVSTAAKLDAAVGSLGLGSSLDLQSRAAEEYHHRMSFQLEF